MIISQTKPSYLKQLKELKHQFKLVPDVGSENTPEMDILVKKLKKDDLNFDESIYQNDEIPRKIAIPKPF